MSFTVSQFWTKFFRERTDAQQYLDAIRKNEVPGLLYLILFLHDLGKDEGPKGHCERGVEIAIPLLKRLGISEEMHDRILFVIRNHLEMVRFANKFDLEDPESIEVFAKFVEGEQRLRFMPTPTVMRMQQHPICGMHIRKSYTPNFSRTQLLFLKVNEHP